MAENTNRRDFLGMTLGGFAAVGAVAGLIAMKKSWDPLPSVISSGTTVIDVGGLGEGQFLSSVWRGKPVYVICKAKGGTFDAKRDFKLGDKIYTVGVQICTHLGCIPKFTTDESDFNKSKFICPCHGGEFTLDGINIEGTPPPIPLHIPPFKINGTKLTLGEKGPEFLKLDNA